MTSIFTNNSINLESISSSLFLFISIKQQQKSCKSSNTREMKGKRRKLVYLPLLLFWVKLTILSANVKQLEKKTKNSKQTEMWRKKASFTAQQWAQLCFLRVIQRLGQKSKPWTGGFVKERITETLLKGKQKQKLYDIIKLKKKGPSWDIFYLLCTSELCLTQQV